MLGVLGLIVHILAPASQMGVVSSIGIGFALLLSLTFIPAVMSTLKKGHIHNSFNKEKKGILLTVLKKTSIFITDNPYRVFYIFLLFLVFSVLGFVKFKIAPDSNKILPLNHPYNKGITIAEEFFGGSKVINLLIQGDIKNPKLLERMEYYQSELQKNPDIGNVLSINTILREISTALNEPSDSLYDRIPKTREAVSQYLELYNMSGNPEDFEKFVDFDYTKALITVQFKAKTIGQINSILSRIEEVTKNDKPNIIIGGYSLVEKQMSESVVKGQYYSLIFALLAIFILLALIFKSLTAGLLGTLPLIFAVLSTFGLMGWLGIELNIVTALISSISIGLGVDFTIHIFWRLKKELALQQNYITAVQTTITTIGRGITINAFSVILGFSILFFSVFPLIQSFALLIILSLLLCLLCALLLIPSLCIALKPAFLENTKHKTLT